MLLKPENKQQLVDLLTYHVIPGEVMSADIAGQELSVDSVQGAMLSVVATDGVMINDATVVSADIKASNGIIHVVDKVIMLPQN